jgi:hypothetical protein
LLAAIGFALETDSSSKVVCLPQKSYRLDKAGQQKARDFAGQKVKVTGRVVGKTIRVTGIEAAS